MSIDVNRFARLLPPEGLGEHRVVVCGCGGIGSYTGVRLAQMGFERFSLVDFDRVGEENIATQDFPDWAVGRPKVEALEKRIVGVSPEAMVETYAMGGEEVPREVWEEATIVVGAMDSIKARRKVWEGVRVQGLEGRERLWVDPRMALESLEVNFVRIPGHGMVGDDEVEWVKSLSDEQAVELPCGAKAVAYTGSFAADIIASQVRRWVKGLRVPVQVVADIGGLMIRTHWREGEGVEWEDF